MNVLFAPKHGSTEEEWEDAAGYFREHGLCAVSDGAGSSYRAARWSAALVQAFLSDPPRIDDDLSAFRTWVGATADRFQADSESVSETSWYAADASRRGSFATFVGVRVAPGDPMPLKAVLVGDVCLFHCRGDVLVTASEVDPDAFNSTPNLLGSSPYGDSYGAERAVVIQAALVPGDVVFLTSDALGAAMLRLARAGHDVWTEFAGLGPKRFDQLVARLRETEVMDNDDVTMLRLEVGAPT